MFFKDRTLEKVDTFIILVCILSAFTSSGWLIYDLTNTKFELEGQEPIGQISTLKNHVKRKFSRSLVWYDASQKETVYENDWVFTGSNSEVRIELNDGGELKIDPDSLIVLTRKNGNLKLNLQHGSLVADVNANVEINVLKDGKLEKLESQLEGPIKIVQNDVIAKPATEADLATNIQPVAKEIKLQYPINSKTVWVKDGEPVALEWSPDTNIKSYKLQVSQDPNFNKALTNTYYKNSAKVKIPQSGKVYWRVADANNPKSTSPIYSFDLKINKSPAITTADGGLSQNMKLTANADGTVNAQLTWQDPLKTWSKYDIQVATDEGFKTLVSQGNTPEALYDFVTKQSGSYFWRVRGISEDGKVISSWSQTQKLNLEIELGIKKSLTLAQKNITIFLNPSDIDTIADNSVTKEVTIKWEANFKPHHYKVLVSADKNFSTIHSSLKTTNKSKLLNSIPMGNAYFIIVAENDKNQTEIKSTIGSIHTLYPTPQELASKTTDTEHNMQWAKVPGIDTYELVWTDAEGNQHIEYVTGNSFKLAKQDGSFTWKVRGIDPNSKEALTGYSSSKRWDPDKKAIASVETVKNSLPIPTITKPAKRKTFVAPGGAPIFFMLEWDFEMKADYYDVEISRNPDMSDTYFKKEIRGKRKLVINQVFPNGKYYMRIEAHMGDSKKAWSAVEVFRVIDKEE